MKKPTCGCAKKSCFIIKGAYPFIEVPMYGHESWSSSGRIETKDAQLEHNFCPECGEPYKEEPSK
jgi:hypothetical protein